MYTCEWISGLQKCFADSILFRGSRWTISVWLCCVLWSLRNVLSEDKGADSASRGSPIPPEWKKSQTDLFSFFNTGSRNLPVKIQRVPVVKRTERGNHHAVTFRDPRWIVLCVSDQSLCWQTLCKVGEKGCQTPKIVPVLSFFLGGERKTDFLGESFRRKEHWNPACWGRMQCSERDFPTNRLVNCSHPALSD